MRENVHRGNAFYNAALFRDIDSLKLLFEKFSESKYTKDQIKQYTISALFGCVRSDYFNYDIMSFLLKKDVDIDKLYDQGAGGLTILYWAVNKMLPYEAIQSLIDHGAKINLKYGINETTVLHTAVYNGEFETVKVLLSTKGVLINQKDVLGQTPLHYAVRANSKVDLKTRINIVDLLIKKGADMDMRDKEGKTPWDIAEALEIKNLLKKTSEKYVDNAFENDKQSSASATIVDDCTYLDGAKNVLKVSLAGYVTSTALYYGANLHVKRTGDTFGKNVSSRFIKSFAENWHEKIAPNKIAAIIVIPAVLISAICLLSFMTKKDQSTKMHS